MKRLIPCIYLYQEKAVKSFTDKTPLAETPIELAKSFVDNDADGIIIFDMSNGDEEHEKALDIMKAICGSVSIPVIGAGNVKRLEDIKKILYTGCKQAVLNFDKEENIEITKEVSERFGKEKLCLSFTKPETLTAHRQLIDSCISLTIWIAKETEDVNPDYLNDPTIAVLNSCNLEKLLELFKSPAIDGVSGGAINDNVHEIASIKSVLSQDGVEVNKVDAKLQWSDLKLNSDGMVPVIVQDYKSDQVLMLAYMNEEAYNRTISTGKMTYYSRSRSALWVKGETSGHTQYVKSLTADCDYDTILAKVKQIGAACHTGSKSCFFNGIIEKNTEDGDKEYNPLRVFEDVYGVIEDRKIHPKEGSYTNYLFDKGLDKILKKVGEEATEIVIAAKNPNSNEVKYEIADFLYHMMVLMAQKGITWEEITTELANR
ncbi:MAG: bifunctional phosphoribosyl-AMP cyclohydrolase/phosphoribosyl-ATP diphosphatase HisIE [Lachnospiraceae bacterium]|nr:bifunctional phosphoribosyl-AMP cyclohydrolase/phosphoribosyl-ATP diphosphatase HisIE [Lachnospiraceae bacterium]